MVKTRSSLLPLVAALCVLPQWSCSADRDEVFSSLQVSFEDLSSQVDESEPLHEIRMRLNAPSSRAVTVRYRIVPGSAAEHDRCLAQDFAAGNETLTFAPGQTSAVIPLAVVQDTLAEADEHFGVEILEVTGASLGGTAVHNVSIIDDDRTRLINVEDFGALPDGAASATSALQAATDEAAQNPGTVVLFPPGTYLFDQLNLAPGVTYSGYGATLLVDPDAALARSRVRIVWSDDADSEPIVVQGLRVHGNRARLGPFENSEQDGSSLIRLRAPASRTGMLSAVLEDITLEDGGGDALEILEDVRATVCDLRGVEVWRDTVSVRGGNTVVSLRGLLATGTTGSTGLWIGPRQVGSDGSFKTDVHLEEAELLDGDLEVALRAGSRLDARRVTMAKGPLRLGADRSEVSISDSVLMLGPAGDRFNLITSPANVTIENSAFVYTENALSEGPTERLDSSAVLHVDWRAHPIDSFTDPPEEPEPRDSQSLTIRNCSFGVADDVPHPIEIVAIEASGDGAHNELLAEDISLEPPVASVFGDPCDGCGK